MTTDRSPLPLPSHIHYELLLQLLERQTARGVQQQPQKEQLQTLIVALRKAFSQQKRLEESCQRAQIPIEYHWSLNGKANHHSSSSVENTADLKREERSSEDGQPNEQPG